MFSSLKLSAFVIVAWEITLACDSLVWHCFVNRIWHPERMRIFAIWFDEDRSVGQLIQNAFPFTQKSIFNHSSKPNFNKNVIFPEYYLPTTTTFPTISSILPTLLDGNEVCTTISSCCYPSRIRFQLILCSNNSKAGVSSNSMDVSHIMVDWSIHYSVNRFPSTLQFVLTILVYKRLVL